MINTVIGVTHSDELPYVFGYPISNLRWANGLVVYSWTSDDRLVSQQMMSWWTNFAKFG